MTDRSEAESDCETEAGIDGSRDPELEDVEERWVIHLLMQNLGNLLVLLPNAQNSNPFGERSFHLFLQCPGTSIVAEAVMTITHSNAGEERIFSLIQKNKTPGRDSLQLDGTLSSLMLVKTHIDDVINRKPNDRLLDAAKKSTRAYNAAHRS